VESDRKAVHQAMAAERQAAENERVQLQLEKEQETGQLQRRFLGAVSAALLAAVGFGGVTFWQYRQSRIGEIDAIATAAEGRFESHHQLEAFEQIITASTKLQQLIRPPAALSKQVQAVLQRTTDGANAINQINFDTEISSLEIHPNGDLLAVVTASGELSFWRSNGEKADVDIARALQSKRHVGQFSNVLFSHDGTQMVLSLKDNSIQLWAMDGTLIKTLTPKAGTELRAFSSDNQTLLVKRQGDLNLLNTESGELTRLPSEQRTGPTDMSADGKLIAGTFHKTLRGIGPDGIARGGRNLTPMQPPVRRLPSGPRQPSKRPGGANSTASSQRPPNVGVWDAGGKLTAAFSPAGGKIEAIAISPNTDLLATAHVDGEVYLSRPDGELVQVLHGLQSKVKELAFSPDGKMLASGDSDGNIELWTVGGSRVKLLLGHKGGLTRLKFSPDSTWLASASQDSTVRLWHTSHSMQTVLAGHTDDVTSLFYSVDGSALISRSIDQSMRIWQRDPEGAFEVAPTDPVSTEVSPYSFSISADRSLLAQRRPNGELSVNYKGEPLKQFDEIPEQVSAVSVAPFGRQMAIATTSNQVQIWRKTAAGTFPADPQHSWSSPDGAVESLVWSPEEQMMIAGTKGGGLTWWGMSGDVGALIASATDAHRAEISAVTVSPDGRWIASASQDKTVKVWHRDGTLAQTLVGHEAGVEAIAFSPDSTKLASVSVDSSLKLWAVGGAVGELPPEQAPLLRSLMGHVGKVNYVAFSPDGKEIATAGSDRKVIVWKIEEILQMDELDYACKQVRDYFRYGPVVDDGVRSLCD